MPRLKENQLPSYRLHKQSGQAIVTLSGRDVLLGKHGSADSKAEYQRVISEWLAGNRMAPDTDSSDLSVSELVLMFWRHAKGYYRGPDGKPTTELRNLKAALRPLRRLYGKTSARDFGPRALKAVIQEMVRMKWCRTHINRQIPRIKLLFKWAVSNELVPASVHHALITVSGLRIGRSDAPESEPVKPVPDGLVDSTLKHVLPQVQAMIELQRLTGMRPAEVCGMRGVDIDTTGKLWLYRPAHHKTQHHGHARVVYFGPKAIEIVRRFLRPNMQEHLFRPDEAEAQRREKLHEQRQTPADQGNVVGSNQKRRPRRHPGDCYTVAAYRRAIARGCEAAFTMSVEFREPRTVQAIKAEQQLPPEEQVHRKQQRRQQRAQWRAQNVWHPHQLRHSAATRLRKEHGLEAAQVILGHKTLTVTQIYAEKNVEAALKIMAEVG
jgi:integrase